MSTLTTFSPSSSSPFQFNPVLDGQTYLAVITWNLFGARWYFNLYTLQSSLVVSLAMVGGANLVGGYFTTSALYYRAASNQFEVIP